MELRKELLEFIRDRWTVITTTISIPTVLLILSGTWGKPDLLWVSIYVVIILFTLSNSIYILIAQKKIPAIYIPGKNEEEKSIAKYPLLQPYALVGLIVSILLPFAFYYVPLVNTPVRALLNGAPTLTLTIFPTQTSITIITDTVTETRVLSLAFTSSPTLTHSPTLTSTLTATTAPSPTKQNTLPPPTNPPPPPTHTQEPQPTPSLDPDSFPPTPTSTSTVIDCLHKWEFNTDGDLEGWRIGNHDIQNLRTEGGSLRGEIVGPLQYLLSPLDLNIHTATYSILTLRYLIAGDRNTSQIMWQPENNQGFQGNWHERYEIVADGQWHELNLDLSNRTLEIHEVPWTDVEWVDKFRMDPTDDGTSGTFAYDYIRICR